MRHWDNLQDQMRRVLPEAAGSRSTTGRSRLAFVFRDPNPMRSRRIRPTPAATCVLSYWGIFEDNDPTKRLIAIANVNGDISEYWEWSDTGFAPVDLNNEAYKYGINYVIYSTGSDATGVLQRTSIHVGCRARNTPSTSIRRMTSRWPTG